MRKSLLNLILLSLLFFLLTPLLILATIDEPLNCCKIGKTIIVEGTTYSKGQTVGSKSTCNLTGTNTSHPNEKRWTLICLLSTITLITDWIFIFSMTFVGLMIIIGGYTITTAAGSPEKINKGKNYILFALIGMVVGLLSTGIPDLIEFMLGVG